ncbi:MAG: GNAT family N-acetyltransferase [Actinomycetota bacterium]
MPKYKLIQINTTDEIKSYREAILGLWKRNLPKLSKDCFDWVYKDNPYGAAKTILAQCVTTGEYVGCAGVYPRMFSLGGKPVRAGVLINFAVDQEHRVFGPAMMMQKEILNAYLSKNFDFILGYPNKGSEGVFRRLGYSFIGEGDYWLKILDWSEKIDNVLRVKIAAVVLGACFDWLCKLFEKFQRIRISSQYTTKNLSELPQDIDALWTRSRKYHFAIGIRNEKYLRWRYQGTENVIFNFFSLYNKGNELCAYIVYQQDTGRITILDIFSDDPVKSRYVLALFVDEMRRLKNKLIVMVYVGENSLKQILKQQCFMRRRDKRALLVSLGNAFTDREKTNLSLLRSWHMSDGELDL